ncbi:MAG: DUF2802 domain-containing protein [Hydrogenophilus sp.]|nr:DUF2802 domain-containing protein [Hydrogenophilus sp.]
MTAFVVAVMVSALAWLAFEGWWWVKNGRNGSATLRHRFAAELDERAWQQEAKRLQVMITTQQQQLSHLQDEVAALRVVVGALERHQRSTEEEHAAKSSSGEERGASKTKPSGQIAELISPEYAEPLTLARRGASPEELVARCGVTLSEAQLICALAARRSTQSP